MFVVMPLASDSDELSIRRGLTPSPVQLVLIAAVDPLLGVRDKTGRHCPRAIQPDR